MSLGTLHRIFHDIEAYWAFEMITLGSNKEFFIVRSVGIHNEDFISLSRDLELIQMISQTNMNHGSHQLEQINKGHCNTG
jgi:hypothetical protein